MEGFGVDDGFDVVVKFFDEFGGAAVEDVDVFFAFGVAEAEEVLAFFSVDDHEFVVMDEHFGAEGGDDACYGVCPGGVPSGVVHVPVDDGFDVDDGGGEGGAVVAFEVGGCYVEVFGIADEGEEGDGGGFEFALCAFDGDGGGGFAVGGREVGDAANVGVGVDLVGDGDLLLCVLAVLFIEGLGGGGEGIYEFAVVLEEDDVADGDGLSFGAVEAGGDVLAPFFIFGEDVGGGCGFGVTGCELGYVALGGCEGEELFFADDLVPDAEVADGAFEVVAEGLVHEVC